MISFLGSVAVPLVVAVAGFVAAYLNNLRIAQRKDRLDRVNRQIGELYGPLMALAETNRITFAEFRKRHGPDVETPFFDVDLTPDEQASWRAYVATVLQPANERMYELVVTKADLLREAEIPQCLLQLSAHVQTYKVTIAKWAEGDFSSHLALIDFPPEVNRYVVDSYRAVKIEQQLLLRRRRVRHRQTNPVTSASE